MLVELVARDAGLDAAVHVGLADVEDARHARQVERDAAAHRRHVAFQRGAGAPGHHRHVRGVAQRQQLRRLVRGLDERHRVRHHRRLGVLAVRVVLAQAGVGGDALAQEVAGGGDHGIDGFGHRGILGRCVLAIGPAGADWQVSHFDQVDQIIMQSYLVSLTNEQLHGPFRHAL